MTNISFKNPIKNIIFNALQNSASDNIKIHEIDFDNGVIDINYENITKAIMSALTSEGYKITK